MRLPMRNPIHAAPCCLLHGTHFVSTGAAQGRQIISWEIWKISWFSLTSWSTTTSRTAWISTLKELRENAFFCSHEGCSLLIPFSYFWHPGKSHLWVRDVVPQLIFIPTKIKFTSSAHGWNPVVVLGIANTTYAHNHHIKITIQTCSFPFLKVWIQVNPWDIPVKANRENREMLQIAWSYELYIKNSCILSFVQCPEMKLKFHFGTAVPVLSVPPQFPRGALSSSISGLHFAFLLWRDCTEGNSCSHLKECPILQCQIWRWVRVLQLPLKSFWHL